MMSETIDKKDKLAVLMTCHNRKTKTLDCLNHLFNQKINHDLFIDVYLVDDGSTDGTSEAVRQTYPEVHLLQGTGHLFWNQGMRLAFATAMENDYDFYLWLNDDTNLYPTALEVLFQTYYQQCSSDNSNDRIIVGSVCDPKTGEHSYGGYVRKSLWHPVRLKQVLVDGSIQECHTMNGNCVLIPRLIAQDVGNLAAEFNHMFGDIDYGFRAKKKGHRIWAAPDYIGTCPPHAPLTYEKFNQILNTDTIYKGVNIDYENSIFLRRHTGILAPIYGLLTYSKLLVYLVFKPTALK